MLCKLLKKENESQKCSYVTVSISLSNEDKYKEQHTE